MKNLFYTLIIIFIFVMLSFFLYEMTYDEEISLIDYTLKINSEDIEYRIYLSLHDDFNLDKDKDNETGSDATNQRQRKNRRGGRRRANRRTSSRDAKLENFSRIKSVERYKYINPKRIDKNPFKGIKTSLVQNRAPLYTPVHFND